MIENVASTVLQFLNWKGASSRQKASKNSRACKMNKLAVVISVLFAVVCVVEARRCRYALTYAICEEQCCGTEDDMLCLESCENITCSSNEDCGKSCCKNGKCGHPNSSDCGETLSTIIAVVISVGIIVAIILGTVFLVRYCRRRRPAPGMIILVNQ